MKFSRYVGTVLIIILLFFVIIYFLRTKSSVPYSNSLELTDSLNSSIKLENGIAIDTIKVFDGLPDNSSSHFLHDVFHLLENNKYVYVFRFTEISCNTCIDSTIRILRHFKLINTEELVILTRYSYETDLYNFKRINRIKKGIYTLGLNQSLLPEIESPYLVVLDRNFCLVDYHVVDKDNLDAFKQFLQKYTDIR